MRRYPLLPHVRGTSWVSKHAPSLPPSLPPSHPRTVSVPSLWSLVSATSLLTSAWPPGDRVLLQRSHFRQNRCQFFPNELTFSASDTETEVKKERRTERERERGRGREKSNNVKRHQGYTKDFRKNKYQSCRRGKTTTASEKHEDLGIPRICLYQITSDSHPFPKALSLKGVGPEADPGPHVEFHKRTEDCEIDYSFLLLP